MTYLYKSWSSAIGIWTPDPRVVRREQTYWFTEPSVKSLEFETGGCRCTCTWSRSWQLKYATIWFIRSHSNRKKGQVQHVPFPCRSEQISVNYGQNWCLKRLWGFWNCLLKHKQNNTYHCAIQKPCVSVANSQAHLRHAEVLPLWQSRNDWSKGLQLLYLS